MINTQTFGLSNRQEKELLERGQRLQLAIPCWPESVGDPVEFAKRSLPDYAMHVTAAVLEEVLVVRPVGTSGLVLLLGELASIDCTNRRSLMFGLTVVVATLSPPTVPRGRRPLQWPGRAYCNGEEIV